MGWQVGFVMLPVLLMRPQMAVISPPKNLCSDLSFSLPCPAPLSILQPALPCTLINPSTCPALHPYLSFNLPCTRS